MKQITIKTLMHSMLISVCMVAHAYAASPSDAALSWIQAQQARSGLYASFEGGKVAYTYDQALAVIALLVKHEPASAAMLLQRLQALQQSDGAWCNAYEVQSLTPQEADKTVGPNMWVAIAVMNYERLTGDRSRYHDMARRAIEWALRYQQADGGVNGGQNAHGEELAYASTEHNIDTYVALKYFGYAGQAEAVKSFLDRVAWSNDHFLVARPGPDGNDVLDVNPWGVMALGLDGIHPYVHSVRYSMTHHRTKQSAEGVSYDAFAYNAERNDIWFEGSNFMVLALRLAGDIAHADYFLDQIIKNQGNNGGVQYALHGTHNGYWKMSTQHAISSTAWLILSIAGYNPLAQ